MEISRQYEIRKVHFQSERQICHGNLYHPVELNQKCPCIVMAHGFSATMDWILPNFATQFVKAGLAVLTFDYRHLGESEGEPRQLIDIHRQRIDLQNAIKFARNLSNIDPTRIGLWGTSLGGSHAIEVAAKDEQVAAIAVCMPALDMVLGSNLPGKMRELKISRMAVANTSIRLLIHALYDVIRSQLGMDPHYIQVFGEPGKAFFTDPRLAPNFEALEKGSTTWKNFVTARFLLGAPRYQSGTAERIKAPILTCLAEKDIEISNHFVKEKLKNSKMPEFQVYPVGHFDMYHEPAVGKLIQDQTRFFKRWLLT